MDYKTMRDRIEDMINDNHKDFVKALISMEKGINDESALDKLYEAYMDNDTVNLLHEEFLAIMQRIFSPPERTFTFFRTSSPENSILPK